jgi:hypothetical protein
VIAADGLADIHAEHPASECLGPAIAAGITQAPAPVGGTDTTDEDQECGECSAADKESGDNHWDHFPSAN